MQISVGPPTKTEPPPLAITPWGAERGLSPQTLRPVLLNNVTLVADSPTVIKSGDLFQDNILGHPGKILAILDFEEVCFNILAIDLVVAFIGCCWIDEKPVEELWFSLLSGYESVRPLLPEERAALPELYRYANLSVAAWRKGGCCGLE